MRRITKCKIVNIVLIISYIVILAVELAFDVFLIPNNIFWFILLILSFGVSELFKFIIFKSDSCLWLSITLLLLAITYISMLYANINIGKYYPLFLISPIIGSLFVGLIFKDVLQLKVILYIVNSLIISFLFSFNVIKIWQFVLILVLTNLLITTFFTVLPNIVFNMVSKE